MPAPRTCTLKIHGHTHSHRYQIVSLTASLLRRDRPIHLLGIGGVRDIFHGVRQGTFVWPVGATLWRQLITRRTPTRPFKTESESNW